MNQRIRELMIKSGAFDYYEVNEGVDGDEKPMEKFAELIIKECCDVFVELRTRPADLAVLDVKKHFEVRP